ncbi:hypothetical protein, partial [Spirulina sp. 06S082]|uniref:hypothetical protein n=1 Tax=Spirulina sp. 06S082 TaxID=3110248 RepID=UPI002B212D20
TPHTPPSPHTPHTPSSRKTTFCVFFVDAIAIAIQSDVICITPIKNKTEYNQGCWLKRYF